MRFAARIILTGLLGLGVLHGQEVKLDEIPTYRLGLDALDGRLWEVAANRFEVFDLSAAHPDRLARMMRLLQERAACWLYADG